ncbi:MAG: hypothetical protein II657_07415, partial [Clostridiales bacterium]|nr:hypothetical protein [Clostridiales bacterium]
MSMINDNNFNTTYGTAGSPASGSPASGTPAPAPVEFKTAGQAMQPPILTPATLSQPLLTPQMMSPSAPALGNAGQPDAKALKKQENAAKKQAKKDAKLAAKQGAASASSGYPQANHSAGTSSGASYGKKRVAAAAVAFCILGAGFGVCATIACGMYWAQEVKSDAVSAAKKAAGKDTSKSVISKNGSKKSSTILQGQRDYTLLNTNNIDTSEEHTAAEIYAANVNSTVGISTQIDYNYYGSK